eukprot:4881142-Pyramimonas_sp.AAC.1
MCVDPKSYRNDNDRKFVPEAFSRRYNDMLALIRIVGSAPLGSIRSQAFSQSKNHQKQGIKGQRVLHCFDAFGMSYF